MMNRTHRNEAMMEVVSRIGLFSVEYRQQSMAPRVPQPPVAQLRCSALKSLVWKLTLVLTVFGLL